MTSSSSRWPSPPADRRPPPPDEQPDRDGHGLAARPGSVVDLLTPRELDVLRLMAEGRTNLGIGRRLWLTERTVETHVSNILTTLELAPNTDGHRRVLAVLAYLDATRPPS